MSQFLLEVEESFQVASRGVAVEPFADIAMLGDIASGHRARVRLVRPDGGEEIVTAVFTLAHFNPGGFHWMCYLENVSREIAPPGTNVWLLDTD